MRLRSILTAALWGSLVVPGLADAQGYTVVPVALGKDTVLNVDSVAGGGLPKYVSMTFSLTRTRYFEGYVDENGNLVGIPTATFKRELGINPNSRTWIDAVMDPSRVVFYSAKRSSVVLGSFQGKRTSLKTVLRNSEATPLAVNSKGQIMLEEYVSQSSSSPRQLRILFFDGEKAHTVYQTKVVRNRGSSIDEASYLDFGFIDDSSRWFISGRHQVGSSVEVFSGLGDGPVASISERITDTGEAPKDFSRILAAGNGLTVTIDGSRNLTVTSADGRIVSGAQGYDDAFISPDGDIFLNPRGGTMSVLTPNGLSQVNCPAIGKGIELVHAYRNGTLLVRRQEKGGYFKAYILKKGGSDCTR